MFTFLLRYTKQHVVAFLRSASTVVHPETYLEGRSVITLLNKSHKTNLHVACRLVKLGLGPAGQAKTKHILAYFNIGTLYCNSRSSFSDEAPY